MSVESVERVKEYLKPFGKDKDVMEFDVSSATVPLAALAVGCSEAQIAKTLSFKHENDCILIVTSGDARIDNRKFKERFGCKASMCSPDEALELTGYAVGGVCPFALPEAVPVYLDRSMRRFDHIYPACGSSNSAVKLTPDELETLSRANAWVDVCKLPENA